MYVCIFVYTDLIMGIIDVYGIVVCVSGCTWFGAYSRPDQTRQLSTSVGYRGTFPSDFSAV